MPIPNRLYRKNTAMEMANLDIYYAENVESRIRNLMSIAKTQIDYKALHNEYMSVRNNTLLNVKLQIYSVPHQRASPSQEPHQRESLEHSQASRSHRVNQPIQDHQRGHE